MSGGRHGQSSRAVVEEGASVSVYPGGRRDLIAMFIAVVEGAMAWGGGCCGRGG